jgi:uridylate kinase
VEEQIVLKIGGSVLYDQDLNINFSLLQKVKDWYYRTKDMYCKRIIVVGGGYLSRELQRRVASGISEQNDLHSIAMSITQTSAEIVKAYIDDDSIFVPKKLGDAYEYLMSNENFSVVSGGLRVGWSTDMDSAVFADIVSAERILKLSNIDYLYDVDPNKNNNANMIKDISWNEYFNLFGISDSDTHQANVNIPVDKECSRFCANKGISFFICGGKNITEKNTLEDILSDGTLIHP